MDDPKSVDVVHFNNGLWDLGQRDGRDCLTPVDVYASTLRRIVDELRHFFPNARIIFATTTPINEKRSANSTRRRMRRWSGIMLPQGRFCRAALMQ